MSRYNLIDEKWIPVQFSDGTRDELGIRDTLLRSREIAVIEDPSPLVVAALHRFLLAVLYRALSGPTDIDKAKDLFRSGFPAEAVTAYLETWRDRFWLFDPNYPFGQVPTFEPKKWRPWTALAVEYNADTAKVLFDHTNEAEPGSISPASAIRWLLATLSFAVSTGKSEISHTGTAPSAGSVMAIPIGLNLQDTLLFCLVPQNSMVMADDLPLWEREPDSIKYLKEKVQVSDKKSGKSKDRTIERRASGIVDVYTWRTRSAIFKESDSGLVSKLGFASGIGYTDSIDCDPMLGYTIKEVSNKDSKGKERRRFSVQFEEKGIWRDFDSLLPDESQLAPKVIEHAVALTKNERNRFPKGVMVVGQKYSPPRPNIAYWRNEHFILPKAISGDRNLRHDIHEALVDAETAADGLNSACKIFARCMLGHGGRKVEKADIGNFVTQLTVLAHYWSTLESRFHEILGKYNLENNPDDVRRLWLSYVRNALKEAWNQHGASVSTGDAWAIRALMKAEGPVLRKLKVLNEEILKYEPQEETA